MWIHMLSNIFQTKYVYFCENYRCPLLFMDSLFRDPVNYSSCSYLQFPTHPQTSCSPQAHYLHLSCLPSHEAIEINQANKILQCVWRNAPETPNLFPYIHKCKIICIKLSAKLFAGKKNCLHIEGINSLETYYFTGIQRRIQFI